MLLQVCSALSHLHHCSPKIIHRDVRAVNVLVNSTAPLELKLSDLGLSHAVSSGPAVSGAVGSSSYGDLTTTTLGPIRWRAPETFDYSASAAAGGPRKQVVSLATDVYMFGCLMYEVLFGQTPWGWLNDEGTLATRARADFKEDPLSSAESFSASSAAATVAPFIRPVVSGPTGSVEEAVGLMRRCCSGESRSRPRIDDVAEELKRIQVRHRKLKPS